MPGKAEVRMDLDVNKAIDNLTKVISKQEDQIRSLQKMTKTSRQADSVFGSLATKMGTFLSVGAGISMASSAMADFAAHAERASAAFDKEVPGRRSLAQIARSPEDLKHLHRLTDTIATTNNVELEMANDFVFATRSAELTAEETLAAAKDKIVFRELVSLVNVGAAVKANFPDVGFAGGMNKAFAAGQQSLASFEGFGPSLGKIMAPAKIAGVSVDDALAMLVVATAAAGGSVEQGSTNVGGLFEALSMKHGAGPASPGMDVLRDIIGKTGGDISNLNEFFPERSAKRGAVAFLEKDKAEFQALTNSIAAGGDSIANQSRIAREGDPMLALRDQLIGEKQRTAISGRPLARRRIGLQIVQERIEQAVNEAVDQGTLTPLDAGLFMKMMGIPTLGGTIDIQPETMADFALDAAGVGKYLSQTFFDASGSDTALNNLDKSFRFNDRLAELLSPEAIDAAMSGGAPNKARRIQGGTTGFEILNEDDSE